MTLLVFFGQALVFHASHFAQFKQVSHYQAFPMAIKL